VSSHEGVHVLSLGGGECLDTWKVTANKLSKDLHTSAKQYSRVWGKFEWGLTTPRRKDTACNEMLHTKDLRIPQREEWRDIETSGSVN
jgi:hypothetical protein